jgi:hypothetical protein
LELKIDSLIVEVKAVREEVKAAQKLNEGLLICLFIAAVAFAFSFFKTNFFFY